MDRDDLKNQVNELTDLISYIMDILGYDIEDDLDDKGNIDSWLVLTDKDNNKRYIPLSNHCLDVVKNKAIADGYYDE